MGEHERMLAQLGHLLSRVARPHACEEGLPDDVWARLRELGFACSDRTSREELITRLWARKRLLLLTIQPDRSGPGTPSAA